RSVGCNRVENAPLAIHPALFLSAEETVEQPVGNHLRGQRALVSSPAHVALHALAKGLLRHADLQRAESRIGADLPGDNLVDRRPARPAAGEIRAGHQTAHRVSMAVSLASRGGVIY